MTPNDNTGMTAKTAQKLEYGIIGLGILALLLIFQPFSISLFTIGAIIVVFAGLINNLLPMAQPGVQARSVVTTAMVVAMVFCIVLLLSMLVAYLYGAFFLNPPDPNTQSGKIQLKATPWYLHSFTQSVAAVAAVLAGLITIRTRKKG
jgi:Mg2+/Co2+ transporter CorB